MEILWKILQKYMLGQKSPTLCTLKGSPGLSHEPVRMLLNLKFIFLGDTRVFSFKVSAQAIHSRLFSAHNKGGNYRLQLCTSENTEHPKAQSVLQRDDNTSHIEQ